MCSMVVLLGQHMVGDSENSGCEQSLVQVSNTCRPPVESSTRNSRSSLLHFMLEGCTAPSIRISSYGRCHLRLGQSSPFSAILHETCYLPFQRSSNHRTSDCRLVDLASAHRPLSREAQSARNLILLLTSIFVNPRAQSHFILSLRM
jgi:hypothetical protein